jgi:hypothetical protein
MYTVRYNTVVAIVRIIIKLMAIRTHARTLPAPGALSHTPA